MDGGYSNFPTHLKAIKQFQKTKSLKTSLVLLLDLFLIQSGKTHIIGKQQLEGFIEVRNITFGTQAPVEDLSMENNDVTIEQMN